MRASPKDKAAPEPAPAKGASPDRTSAVVSSTIVALALVGVGTIFWEPLAALAVGSPTGDVTDEARGGLPQGGAATPSAARDGGAAAGDGSGNS
jgi:hypothetical protein